MLKGSQPPKMYSNLKFSNIQFVHDELGPRTLNREGRNNVWNQKKNSVSTTKNAGACTTSAVSIENDNGNDFVQRSGTSQSVR